MTMIGGSVADLARCLLEFECLSFNKSFAEEWSTDLDRLYEFSRIVFGDVCVWNELRIASLSGEDFRSAFDVDFWDDELSDDIFAAGGDESNNEKRRNIFPNSYSNFEGHNEENSLFKMSKFE